MSLPAAANVTNITLQNQCPLDQSDHLEIAYDPVALADVLNALDPAAPVHAVHGGPPDRRPGRRRPVVLDQRPTRE